MKWTWMKIKIQIKEREKQKSSERERQHPPWDNKTWYFLLISIMPTENKLRNCFSHFAFDIGCWYGYNVVVGVHLDKYSHGPFQLVVRLYTVNTHFSLCKWCVHCVFDAWCHWIAVHFVHWNVCETAHMVQLMSSACLMPYAHSLHNHFHS